MVSSSLREQLEAAQEQAHEKVRDRQRTAGRLKAEVERRKADVQQARAELTKLEGCQRVAADRCQELLAYQKGCVNIDLSDRLNILADDSRVWLQRVERQRVVLSEAETELRESETRMAVVIEGYEEARRNWQGIVAEIARADQPA
jgi:multidrug resistance efflux pump